MLLVLFLYTIFIYYWFGRKEINSVDLVHKLLYLSRHNAEEHDARRSSQSRALDRLGMSGDRGLEREV